MNWPNHITSDHWEAKRSKLSGI